MNTRFGELSRYWQHVALVFLVCAALAACQSKTDVSAGANVPVQYSHVWVTLQGVAFNTSATAGPQDSGWTKFTLTTPQTIDLTTVTNGTLAQFANSLSLPTGTYNQMQLVLADSNASLTSSAQSAGALYNDEVDTTDSGGTLQQLPLQVPNAAQGITFSINLTIQSAQNAALAAFACGQSSSSGLEGTDTGTSSTCEAGTANASDCTSGTLYDSIIGTCIAMGGTDTLTGASTTAGTPSSCAYGSTYDSTTGACISTGTTTTTENCAYDQVYDPTTGTCTSSLTSAETTSVALDFDAARDLVPYSLGGQSGFVLIPHVSAYNLAQAGNIEGQVDVSALPSIAGGIEVTAETPSSSGTQNVIVASAPLQSTGTFVLYPLPCSTTATSSTTAATTSTTPGSTTAASTCSTVTQNYDLVIHGPGIETVIVQSVPVTTGAPSSGSALSLGVVLTAATSYSVNLSSAVSPAGSWIGFYQTLPSSSTVSLPYVIDAVPVDPFTGMFDTAQSLSAGSLEYGVYAAGSAVALTAVTPTEGASTYHVAASAPLYGNGALSTTVAPPSSGSGTSTFTVAAIPLPSGTTADTISGTVSVATPGKYNQGELVLTQNGALVAVTSLAAYLGSAQSTATLFSSVPGGTPSSVYYAEAWVWNSSDPSALSRQPQSTPIDLSSGSASGVTITIN